ITTFLISPLLQDRQEHHESWSAVANLYCENPELPAAIQIRCQDRAKRELCAMRAACQKFSNFSRVRFASEILQANEPSSRRSFRHLPRTLQSCGGLLPSASRRSSSPSWPVCKPEPQSHPTTSSGPSRT